MNSVQSKKVWQRVLAVVIAVTVVVSVVPVPTALALVSAARCEDTTASNFNQPLPCRHDAPVPPPVVLCLEEGALNINEEGPCEFPPEEEPVEEEPEVTLCLEEGALNINEEAPCVFPEEEAPEEETLCLDDGALNFEQVGECQFEEEEGPEDSEEMATDSVEIDYPNDEEDTVTGEFTVSATVTDEDESVSAVNWMITTGTCDEEEGDMVAGNTDDFEGDYHYGPAGLFTADVDATTWLNGDYCLTVDPIEPEEGPEVPDIYAEQDFVVENPTFTLEGYKYEDTNKSNAIDEGDQLVPGWPVYAARLIGFDDVEVFEAETDESGHYSFTVPTGIWVVFEGEKPGWSQVLARTNQAFAEEDMDMFSEDEEEEFDEATTTECGFLAFTDDSDFSRRDSEESYQCDFLNVRVEMAVDENDTPTTTATTTEERRSTSGTRTGGRRAPAGQVLGIATSTAATQCTDRYLTSYMRRGSDNDTAEVMKLQQFLTSQGYETPVTGTFGTTTEANVMRFQSQYTAEVLAPWELGLAPTGFVYKLTRWKINNIVCPGSEALPVLN